MSDIDIALAKIAGFAKTKSGQELAQQGYPDSLGWRLIQEANRFIDDAYWNDYRNDTVGAVYCRYLAEVYVNLAKELAPQPNQ
jgi:hypothetical protein